MPYYTGIKTVLTLRKYVDGQATTETKANSASDPDYIPPFEDTSACPIVAYTTTTTTIAPSSSLVIWRSTTGGGHNPPTGWSTAALACSSAANATTVYFSQNVTGWDDAVSNSLVVYEDAGASVPYQGRNTFFRSAQTAGTGKTFQLSNTGVISSYVTCVTTTTSTTSTTTTTTTAAPGQECYNYIITAGQTGAVTFTYTPCGDTQSTSVTLAYGQSQTVCAKVNTVTMSPNTGTIVASTLCS